MVTGWSVSTDNGFVHIKNGPTFPLRIAQPPVEEKVIAPPNLVLLALHMLWISFYPNIATAACFVQSKTLTDHADAFWGLLFQHLAWILLPPEPIRDAMWIGRPDLSEIVQKGYMEWIARVRNPAHVEKAISVLTTKPWNMCTHTKLWRYMESVIISACIQVGTTKTFHIDRNMRPSIVATASDKPAIVLNGHVPLAVHRRDMILVIIILLFGNKTQWAVNGPSEDAPAQFLTLQTEMPYLFSENVEPPYILFDDLPIMGKNI